MFNKTIYLNVHLNAIQIMGPHINEGGGDTRKKTSRGRPQNGAYSLLMTRHYLKYPISENMIYIPTR